MNKNVNKITAATWLKMKPHERTAAWRAARSEKETRELIQLTIQADKLERTHEIQARKKSGASPPPDYQKAKAILISKFAENNISLPTEDVLALCLDQALDCDPTDGPTMMTSDGDCLLGPTDADWAEMAMWVHLSD